MQKTVTDIVSFRAGTVSGLVKSSARRKYPVLLKTTLLKIRQQDLYCLQRTPIETIDKILFSACEAKTTVPTAQVGLEVLLPAKQNMDKTEISIEQAETITEETAVPDVQVGLEVPVNSNDVEHKAVIITEQAVSVEENKAQEELKRILAKKNCPTIRFKNTEHEANYNFILDMMPCSDPERKVLAYLFAVDTVCFEHIRELYDFEGDSIKTDALDKDWQTGTSCKTTILAFNLYNSFCSDSIEDDLSSVSFTPVELFCSEYAEYYVEALRIRFPEFFEGGF